MVKGIDMIIKLRWTNPLLWKDLLRPFIYTCLTIWCKSDKRKFISDKYITDHVLNYLTQIFELFRTNLSLIWIT